MRFSNLQILATYLILFALSSFTFAEDAAKVLFEKHKAKVFQIKVIDIGSGNKSSIGSGFLIDSQGTIATNYHVVSDFVIEPDKYRIELLDHEENTFPLELLNYDIIHDLALAKLAEPFPEKPFSFSKTELFKGNRIYSMGNPHDLGMTIIEGNYNGLVEGSRYRNYLFSGSLNGGMSGGPTINGKGEVIGINVSKGGEQLSFLVPVSHLQTLIDNTSEKIPEDLYKAHSLKALIKDQDDYFQRLNEMEWKTLDFMSYNLPDKFDDSLKCWGHTIDKKKKRYDETHRHCRTEDRIYISSDLFTGNFSFVYEYISTEELDVIPFFNMLEESYEIWSFSNGNKEDTTNFICSTNFIKIDNGKWKITSCIREYIDYRGLYDAGLLAMRVDQNDQTLKVGIRTTGIDKVNIEKLHKKFLDMIVWKE